MLLCVTLVIS